VPDSAPAVNVEHVHHRYGERVALHDVSLLVASGQTIGLLGPNGSGKTTLFRILSTLIRPQEGRVIVGGADVAGEPHEVRRRIGVVFQSPSLDKQLTAEENLHHHGHLYGLRGAALQDRAKSLLARVGLADRTHDRIETFSGGMRRRVELAKGLLTRPQVLLLDEPSTGVDPAARLEMWRCLGEARALDGVTVLLTTHLMDEADRCDRVAVLNAGRIVAFATPAELKGQVGGDVITLSTRDPDGVRLALRERFNIEATGSDSTVRFERSQGHAFLPALFEALPAGGIESITVGKPTLEDVFLRLTGRRFGSGG
jgi:ABC-2 type transport system ATP-binding protein